jgi:hypothetical protein
MINGRNQIIQIVACDNYDAFPHLSFIFFQLKHEIEVWKTIINIIKICLKYEISFLFDYFRDYLMTKLTLG